MYDTIGIWGPRRILPGDDDASRHCMTPNGNHAQIVPGGKIMQIDEEAA